MTPKITCVLCKGADITDISTNPLVADVYRLDEEQMPGILSGELEQTATLKKIISICQTPYLLLCTKSGLIECGTFALERAVQVADMSSASLLYSDYREEKEGVLRERPLIDYQSGSLRDDFNFGALWLLNTEKCRKASEEMQAEYKYAGLYDLRLQLNQLGNIIHLPEMLYTEKAQPATVGNSHFAYVDPKNRAVQIEMEEVCTQYLKKIGAWVAPGIREIEFSVPEFPIEASVVIPVKNRENTIAEAVQSVLRQKTNFTFNLIVVDNHSTDRTTEILKTLAEQDKRLIHIVPESRTLGIGGCWNRAITDERCGKFSIQLDSDDLYIDDQVIQKIVNAFYEQKAAAIIGSYRIVDFRLEEIPPGLIDHREWTDENGMNNGLRINGFGAPRAFFTSILREIKFPDTSYGEDYAVVLAISRRYRIGRIYEPLYLCRRWEGNSDASLSVEKENRFNFYKDKIRTLEVSARIRQNQTTR